MGQILESNLYKKIKFCRISQTDCPVLRKIIQKKRENPHHVGGFCDIQAEKRPNGSIKSGAAHPALFPPSGG